MSDKLTQPNEQTADSTAEPSAAPTAEATGASAEVNANGHPVSYTHLTLPTT